MYPEQVKNRRNNIDLQLLACLDALISECSVTRAAERMDMSQPGMSNALARLRRLTSDQILVRTARGMMPTPRARELAQSVQTAMRALEDVLGDRGPFDPAGARGTVTIATTDFAGVLVCPKVLAVVRERAPGLSLEMRLPDPLHVAGWLTEGECDIMIGYLPSLSSGLRCVELFQEPLALISSSTYASLKEPLALDDIAQALHVVQGSPFAALSTVEAMLDTEFSRLQIKRSVGIRVSSMVQVPYMVADTDLLSALPAAMARHYASFLPIRLLRTSFELPRISVSMVWHERSHRIGMHAWMRHLIREVVEQEFPRRP